MPAVKHRLNWGEFVPRWKRRRGEESALLDLYPGAAKNHLDRVYAKFDVYNRLGAAMRALQRLRLFDADPFGFSAQGAHERRLRQRT